MSKTKKAVRIPARVFGLNGDSRSCAALRASAKIVRIYPRLRPARARRRVARRRVVPRTAGAARGGPLAGEARSQPLPAGRARLAEDEEPGDVVAGPAGARGDGQACGLLIRRRLLHDRPVDRIGRRPPRRRVCAENSNAPAPGGTSGGSSVCGAHLRSPPDRALARSELWSRRVAWRRLHLHLLQPKGTRTAVS